MTNVNLQNGNEKIPIAVIILDTARYSVIVFCSVFQEALLKIMANERKDNPGMRHKMSVTEIPGPLEINDQPRSLNGNFPSRSRRSVWFGKSFGPLGKYGKLKKAQFIMGASSLEVKYTIISYFISCSPNARSSLNLNRYFYSLILVLI